VSARRLLAALAATVVLGPAVAAAPAAAQSTTETLPGATVTIPGAGTTTPSTTTSPGSATTATTPTTTTPEITAAQAGDGVLIAAEDRVELASSLAEATSESGICFGYEVSLGGSGASDRDETLSNAGPDRAPEPGQCPKGSLVLVVNLTYTSSSSESEDSASFRVESDVAGLSGSQATQRIKDVSGIDDDDLLGDDDDLALRNAAAALPLIVDGAEPAELAASTTDKAPNGDRLTGSPGGDWVRAHGVGIGIAVLLLVLGIVLVLGGRAGRRKAGPTPPTPPSRPTGSGPTNPPAMNPPRPMNPPAPGSSTPSS
jgi:hypothetical protein